MSGNESTLGFTRRGFGVILSGLTAGAILGTTVAASAAEHEQPGPTTPQRDAPQHEAARPDPAVVRFDPGDVDSLAAKLDSLKLADNERVLLAGLLGVAVDVIKRTGPGVSISPLVSSAPGQSFVGVKRSGPSPSFRDEFSRAFTPGAVDRPFYPMAKKIGGE